MMMDYQSAAQKLFMSYNRATPNLSGLDSQTRDLTAIRQLFELAAIPLNLAPTVTITGSKGKGSTAIMTAALLQGMGHRVGLLTSPSFLSLRERVRLNLHAIPEADFVRIVGDLAPLIDQIDSTLAPDKYLSPTGLFLAVGLRYFHENAVSAMVLEVGRGGRFDDVRLVENQVSCLTPIMDEHRDKFGAKPLDVVWHKAGIIKPDSQVVSANQSPEVTDYLVDYCAQVGAELFVLDQDFSYQSVFDGIDQIVDVQFPALGQTDRFTLSTPARYQAQNLVLAFANASLLTRNTPRLSAPAPLLSRVRLVGRCDVLRDTAPKVIVDGAINRESAQQFRESVAGLSDGVIALVTALPHDKDYRGVLEVLLPAVQHAIVTHVTAGHLNFSDDVQEFARQYMPDVVFEKDVFSAFKQAEQNADTVWVVGTQSLVRDALDYWGASLESLLLDG